MELKINYQYTYFIQPFIINEGKYKQYMLKMLKDKKINLKQFSKEKDLRLYKYFLPKTRELLFNNFRLTKAKINELEELPMETRAAILGKQECNIFEYMLENNIQGKVDSEEQNGIFFNIEKIEIICFKTGISFLCIKTNLDQNKLFADVLNFNYKFRDINNEMSNYDNYDNIRIQINNFSDIETFQEFVKKITGDSNQIEKIDVDNERFFTYSYTCIDQESWKDESSFKNIEEQFIKYTNTLPADSNKKYSYDKIKIFSKWKYAKIGLTKQSCNLFSSSKDINNFTVLAEEFENQYLYTVILNLYKKIMLKNIIQKLNSNKMVLRGRKDFIDFSKKIWIFEMTENETGTLLDEQIQEKLELNKLYNNVKEKFELLYKTYNIQKNKDLYFGVFIISTITLIVSILGIILN